MQTFQIRPLNETDYACVTRLLEDHWGSVKIITRGKIHQADSLPGFIAIQQWKAAGLVTYRIDGDECEIVSLDSLAERIGIGSALINAVRSVAIAARCKRLWLITTNDNLAAVRFYQKRGFVIAAIHCNVIDQSRKLKPEILRLGIDDIPIRDEIELELLL